MTDIHIHSSIRSPKSTRNHIDNDDNDDEEEDNKDIHNNENNDKNTPPTISALNINKNNKKVCGIVVCQWWENVWSHHQNSCSFHCLMHYNALFCQEAVFIVL